MDILYAIAKDQHLDVDIVQLLISSGIYEQYAKKFLPAQQIDKIDLASYL